jgi:hypothetical protein
MKLNKYNSLLHHMHKTQTVCSKKQSNLFLMTVSKKKQQLYINILRKEC